MPVILSEATAEMNDSLLQLRSYEFTDNMKVECKI